MSAGTWTQGQSCLVRDAAPAHFSEVTALFSRARGDLSDVQVSQSQNTSSPSLLLFADRVVQHGPGQPLQLLALHAAVQLGPY